MSSPTRSPADSPPSPPEGPVPGESAPTGSAAARLATWKSAFHRGLVGLAWAGRPGADNNGACTRFGEPGFGVLADHPGLPDPGWEGLWARGLDGPEARALVATGAGVAAIADVELQRVERVGAGPVDGVLRRGPDGWSEARRRLHARVGADRLDAERWRTLRWAIRTEGVPWGLRRALLDGRVSLPGDARLGATAPRLAAATTEPGGRYSVDVEVEGAPPARVHLEIGPTMDGALLCLVTRTSGDGPVEMRVWGGTQDAPIERAVTLARGQEAATWYEEGALGRELRVFAWAPEGA